MQTRKERQIFHARKMAMKRERRKTEGVGAWYHRQLYKKDRFGRLVPTPLLAQLRRIAASPIWPKGKVAGPHNDCRRV